MHFYFAATRVCRYGSQQFGAYNPAGIEVVAELLQTPDSTLTHLDIASNAIGPSGGKVLYEALRQNDVCALAYLDVRHSRFDKVTEIYLAEVADARVPPLTIQL